MVRQQQKPAELTCDADLHDKLPKKPPHILAHRNVHGIPASNVAVGRNPRSGESVLHLVVLSAGDALKKGLTLMGKKKKKKKHAKSLMGKKKKKKKNMRKAAEGEEKG